MNTPHPTIEKIAALSHWARTIIAERDVLKAENKRLREALHRITQHPVRTPVMGRRNIGFAGFPACQDIARAALAETETKR